MELVTEVLNNQFVFYIPVALVLVVAALVFTFGFKSAEQPQFDKLTSLAEDRKPVGKKRKTKEKKSTANGHATQVSEAKHSPSKEAKKSPAKDTDSTKLKDKKQTTSATKLVDKRSVKGKEPFDETTKNKKNIKKTGDKEIPVDIDDGNWETVLTKVDKKNRKNQETPSPPKKEKGSKKVNKDEFILAPTDNKKTTKEDINKGLQEKAKKEKSDGAKDEIEVILAPAGEQEKTDDTKSKKKAKKPKEDIVEVIEKELEKKEKAPKKEASPKKESPIPKKEGSPKKETPIPKIDVATVKEPVKKKKMTATEAFLANERDSEPLSRIAFDELGDSWVAPKKTKKKTRKEN